MKTEKDFANSPEFHKEIAEMYREQLQEANEILMDMVGQFAYPAAAGELAFHAGGMSVLEGAIRHLLSQGLIEKVSEHPDKEWYRFCEKKP